MRYLHSLISLNNLKNNNAAGQIATIMILMMVAVLIFILVTINMGNVSERATRLANAVDSATLALASRLATQTYMLSKQLGGHDEVCTKGGLLGIVLAVVLAVIAIILAPVTAGGSLVLYCAIAGAIGGAIGGAIIHGNLKGAAMGAIQGAMIGAAIGAGASMGAQIGASIGSPAGLTAAGAKAGLAAMAAGAPMSSGFVVGATIGMVIGAALPAAAAIYNGTVEENMKSTTLANLAKMLNGLPEYDSLREQLFFQAFSQTVDEQNVTGPNFHTNCGNGEKYGADPCDLNGDGDLNDQQPVFSYWWYNHLRFLQGRYKSGAQVIEDFVENTLKPATTKIKSFLPDMDRKNIECNCEHDAEDNPYGPMEQLFRAVKDYGTADAGLEINAFWIDGPIASPLQKWYKHTTFSDLTVCDYSSCTDETCDCINMFDTFDGLRMEYEEFLDWVHAVLNADNCGNFFYDPNELDKDDNWLDILYKPDRLKKDNVTIDKRFRGDFYDTLYVGALGPDAGEVSNETGLGTNEKGIKQWREHIIKVRDYYLNPCKISYATASSPVKISNKIEPVSPFCNEYDYDKTGSLYPCNWTLVTDATLTGVYAAPKSCHKPPCDFEPCKLDSGDKININTDVNNLKDYINNQTGVRDHKFDSRPIAQRLEARIRSQIPSLHPRPCSADDDGSIGLSDCTLLSIDNVIVTDLRLETTTTGWTIVTNNKLKYNYKYEYTCQCSQNNDCCTCGSLDANGNCIDCQPNSHCSTVNTVHHDPDFGYGQGEIELNNLNLANIPSGVNEWLPISDFITALNEISNTLNDPAKLSDTFATINEDLSTDEFSDVLGKLQEQEDFLLGFLPEVKTFYDKFQVIKNDPTAPRPTNAGGTSPTYTWTDKTGEHSVSVQVGKAKFSKISREEHGNFLKNKKCLVVEKVNAGQAWVKITREDEGEKPLSSSGKQDLGFKWNPGFGQKQKITRKARAQYGSKNVGIRDIWNDDDAQGKFPGEE